MNFLPFVVVAFLCFGYTTSSTGASQFVKVGCFEDKKPRALPELLANYRGKLNWNNLKEVVKKCAQEAKKRNYMYFGIQFYGECWSGITAPLTYDRYGQSQRCTSEVGRARANLVYRFIGEEKECLDYLLLNSASRFTTSNPPKGITPFCDDDLSPGWYRFLRPAGDQMASKCVPTQKCGTAVTGWLSSGHPKMTDGIVNGKVCFHWSNSCCMHHQYIKVRNCGRFFVYKLAKAIGCPMRFCGANTV